MTGLSASPSAKQLGLVIDLDICVGCHACAVNCKEWNAGGHAAPDRLRSLGRGRRAASGSTASTPLRPGKAPRGRTVHFPKSRLHCAEPACVTVCPTGASYKRAEDGIVLVNGTVASAASCVPGPVPTGPGVRRRPGRHEKCTLCIDRIYNETLDPADRVPACVATCPVGARHSAISAIPNRRSHPQLVASREGYDLMPELGYRPATNTSRRARARRRRAAPGPRRSWKKRYPRTAARRCCAGSTAFCRARSLS